MLRRQTYLKVQTLWTLPDNALRAILWLAILSGSQSIAIIVMVIS